jgi:hypothetical protein
VVRVPGYRSRGPGFDSRHYQILWEVVGLEQGPLSLVSTIEELLGRNNSGSGQESREYGRRNPLCWPRNILYPQKLALTLPTSGGRGLRQRSLLVCCFLSEWTWLDHLKGVGNPNFHIERDERAEWEITQLLKSPIFCEIVLYSLLNVDRLFGGEFRLYLRCRRLLSRGRNV